MFELANLLKSSIGWLNAKGPFSEIVISSRVRLARNFQGIRFPHIALPRELKQSWELVANAVRRSKELNRAAYVKLSDLNEVDLNFLVERHLISMDLAKNPIERGVIIGDKEMISLMVNEEDHLRLQVLYPGFCLAEALSYAMALDHILGEEIPYAYREDFGFITSCPTNIGTGLRASNLIHLPALVATQNISSVLQELARIGLVARGFYGEGSKTFGDLFQISNATSIGKSEKDFTDTMQGVLKKVLRHEVQMRERLFSGSGKARVLDRLWRAYGVLTNARFLSFEETMQELSRLRLGLSMGVKFDHLELGKLNEMILITQPAHIQMMAQKELKPHDRDELRAILIRKTLGFK